MAIETKYLEDIGILLVNVTGKYIVSDDTSELENLLTKTRELNCSKILVDYRQAAFSANTVAAFNRPNVLENLGVDRDLRVAAVYNELTEDSRFTELVYQNKGWDMKDFTDYDEAIKWLTVY